MGEKWVFEDRTEEENEEDINRMKGEHISHTKAAQNTVNTQQKAFDIEIERTDTVLKEIKMMKNQNKRLGIPEVVTETYINKQHFLLWKTWRFVQRS